jgi:hypothetical protein
MEVQLNHDQIVYHTDTQSMFLVQTTPASRDSEFANRSAPDRLPVAVQGITMHSKTIGNRYIPVFLIH